MITTAGVTEARLVLCAAKKLLPEPAASHWSRLRGSRGTAAVSAWGWTSFSRLRVGVDQLQAGRAVPRGVLVGLAGAHGWPPLFCDSALALGSP